MACGQRSGCGAEKEMVAQPTFGILPEAESGGPRESRLLVTCHSVTILLNGVCPGK